MKSIVVFFGAGSFPLPGSYEVVVNDDQVAVVTTALRDYHYEEEADISVQETEKLNPPPFTPAYRTLCGEVIGEWEEYSLVK